MDYLIYNLADAHLQSMADASLLSEDERRMAERRDERYVLTRSLLRQEIARRLGDSPQHICFRYGEQGKPECDGLHFNISHSGDCFAMAFDTAPIGIDVERVRPRARLESLAARIMCPEQLAAFRERGCPLDEFYTCWCAAEALVKQAGGSIWRASEHPFTCQHGRLFLPEGDKRTLLALSPAPEYRGVVAFVSP